MVLSQSASGPIPGRPRTRTTQPAGLGQAGAPPTPEETQGGLAQAGSGPITRSVPSKSVNLNRRAHSGSSLNCCDPQAMPDPTSSQIQAPSALHCSPVCALAGLCCLHREGSSTHSPAALLFPACPPMLPPNACPYQAPLLPRGSLRGHQRFIHPEGTGPGHSLASKKKHPL